MRRSLITFLPLAAAAGFAGCKTSGTNSASALRTDESAAGADAASANQLALQTVGVDKNCVEFLLGAWSGEQPMIQKSKDEPLFTAPVQPSNGRSELLPITVLYRPNDAGCAISPLKSATDKPPNHLPYLTITPRTSTYRE
jgi:hypothetical protein